MMPVTTSRPSDTMLNAADEGPPVSGNTEAEAVGLAVALAEGLGEPPSDGNGVKGPPVVLAIVHGVSDSAGGLVVQTGGATLALALGLEDCAKATEANSSTPSVDRPTNINTLLEVLKVSPFRKSPLQSPC